MLDFSLCKYQCRGDLKFLTFLHFVSLLIVNNIITVPLWRHFIFRFGVILLMMFAYTFYCQLLLMINIGCFELLLLLDTNDFVFFFFGVKKVI
jgi:hypothetical protein